GSALPGLYTLSLHDALPILERNGGRVADAGGEAHDAASHADALLLERTHEQASHTPPLEVGMSAEEVEKGPGLGGIWRRAIVARSEEHTSELQSRFDLVCRL